MKKYTEPKRGTPDPKKHSFSRRILGILLSFFLVAAALPIEYYEIPSLSAQEPETAAAPPEEIKESEGADQEPDTVTVPSDHLGQIPAIFKTNVLEETGQEAKTDLLSNNENGETQENALPASSDTGNIPELADEAPPIPESPDARDNVHYTLTFYSGGPGQKTSLSTYTDTYNDERIAMPKAEEVDGFTFYGWRPENAGPNTIHREGELLTLHADTEYYAVYSKQIVLAYYDSPGSLLESSLDSYFIKIHNEIEKFPPTYTINPAPALNLPGYNFLGWSMNLDGSGVTFAPGDTIEPSDSIDLYPLFHKSVTARFYSGQAGQAEDLEQTVNNLIGSGTIYAPKLKEMDGWTALGWGTDPNSFDVTYTEGSPITITDHISYYGIYQKEITVSYDANGGLDVPQTETLTHYANVSDIISFECPRFVTPTTTQDGFEHAGWCTDQNEIGDFYLPSASVTLSDVSTSNVTLYAIWYLPNSAAYKVEYFMQDLDGNGYIKADTETVRARGTINTSVTADAKDFNGFTENTSHPLRKASGTVTADNGLTLSLYYDRILYHVNFDLNGGTGEMPGSQSLLSGSYLQEAATPARNGYNFKGWYLDPEGTDGCQWDFGKPIEENASSAQATLFAKWVDETPPVLGEASYNPGYQGLFHWIVQKKGLTITVPIIEEGSGIKEAQYILIAEDGADKAGNAQIGQAESQNAEAMRVRVRKERNQTIAQFTIDEDFKGAVAMTCTDNAGNTSAQKILTADGGGLIVEDNAPQISFITADGGLSNEKTLIDVLVEDGLNDNISGGIANISYQIDKREQISLPTEPFHNDIIESYRFTVEISGNGTHTLLVTANDNAGNVNAQQITVKIGNIDKDEGQIGAPGNGGPGGNTGGGNSGNGDYGGGTPENGGHSSFTSGNGTPGSSNSGNGEDENGSPTLGNPDVSKSEAGNLGKWEPRTREPRTGEISHVEIYATIAMITGFAYLLLYFTTGTNSMTPQKKEELVARLICWANSGCRFRKLPALAAIFLLLAYYHSIGKSMAGGWEGVMWKLNMSSGS